MLIPRAVAKSTSRVAPRKKGSTRYSADRILVGRFDDTAKCYAVTFEGRWMVVHRWEEPQCDLANDRLNFKGTIDPVDFKSAVEQMPASMRMIQNSYLTVRPGSPAAPVPSYDGSVTESLVIQSMSNWSVERRIAGKWPAWRGIDENRCVLLDQATRRMLTEPLGDNERVGYSIRVDAVLMRTMLDAVIAAATSRRAGDARIEFVMPLNPNYPVELLWTNPNDSTHTIHGMLMPVAP